MNNTQNAPQATIQAIQLIEGQFKTSEASDIINEMLDSKINFHNLETLKRLEGNHNDPCTRDGARLEQLKADKRRFNEKITELKTQGKKMKIHSTIMIEVID